MFYRIAAILIVLFDIRHSSNYPWSDPAWGVDISGIRSNHFSILGFSRTYWDFYVGFGLFVSLFLLPTAVLAWQMGSLPLQSRLLLRSTAWVLALCFAAIAVLSWMYFFSIPIAFSSLITICLAMRAWRSNAA